MELKEFIKATIATIAEATEELNAELKNKAIVNPKSMYLLDQISGKSDKVYTTVKQDENTSYNYLIQEVEFNLAITEAKSNEKGGGIKIEVFNAGVNNKKEIENVNTVKFSIPVAFLK